MARTRTTIRRIDPWSILKFAFVANLVLLGIELLAGVVVWYVIQRLELIQTVCELAGTVGFEECGVDGGALFDTILVLGLLGVVIQTGIMVFLAFLANLIFDLTGGIVVTLEDDRAPSGTGRSGGVGTRATGAAAMSRASRSGGSGTGSGTKSAASDQTTGGDKPPVAPLGSGSSPSDSTATTATTTPPSDSQRDGGSNDDTLFGSS